METSTKPKTALIQKRNKSYQDLSIRKIERAILMAFSEVTPNAIPDIRPIADAALKTVMESGSSIITINEIQDAVEKALMAASYHDVAKAYILYRANRDSRRESRLTPDNMALADYLHNAKYARYIREEFRKEVHEETVSRVERMNLARFPELKDEIVEAFRWVRERKLIPSMRSMQFAGEPMERVNARCYNCLGSETTFVTSDGVRAFSECEDGERVTIMTPSGLWSDATVRNYGKQKLLRIKMRRGRSEFVVRATKDHRWILHDGSVTTSLKEGDRIAIGPKFSSYYASQEHSWVDGFHYGDGTINKRGSNSYKLLRLCGDKRKYLSKFEELGYNHSSPPSYNGDVVVYMNKGEKALPSLPDSEFVNGLLHADGAWNKDHTGFRSIQATGSDYIEWLRRNLPACGYYILNEDTPSMETNFGKRSGETVRFSLLNHSEDPGHSSWKVIELVDDVEEDVWCLEVDAPDKAFVLANGVVTGNCSFSPVDRVRFFQEAFYLLLCGCGVGFSVQWHHVNKLPPISNISKHKVLHHTVKDSIEGWSDALGALVQSYVDGVTIEFNYSEIRPEGSPISSGGKAPGHIPLRIALEKIREVLHKAQGRSLRPIECHDIVCFTAEAVLAGGIRRSSLISLFSPDDGEMMRCKTSEVFRPSFSEGDPGVNNQRQMANNSAVFLRSEVKEDQFKRLMTLASQSWGEPGFFFTENRDYGTNPCAEISLNPTISYEELASLVKTYQLDLSDEALAELSKEEGLLTGFSFCNLTEINMARIKSEEEFYAAARAGAFIGTLQASYNSFPYLGAVTEAIQRREALLGVSLTGMADNPEIAFNPTFQRKAAIEANKENQRVAKLIGIRPAARVTTIKPSGSASVVLGVVGSGIHPHHARRYFRRINGNKNEPAAVYFKSINPHMVENKPDGTWSLVFPIEAPENAITIKEESALLFLERVFSTYENWIKPGTAIPEMSPGATHNVSCTVTVRDHELPLVVEEVWKNRHRIAAMSFAPFSLDKMFPFAPREEVTTSEDEEKWNRLISHYRKVDWSQMVEMTDTSNPQAEIACGGGQCDL